MFSNVADEYEERFGLDRAHLRGISEIAFSNAKKNPNSQTRKWAITPDHFADNDELNPHIEGSLRKADCGQVTDGAAAIFLASREVAEQYAKRRGIALESLPRIKGWGHATAPLLYSAKVNASRGQPYVFPTVRKAMMDALGRAGMEDIYACDGVEVHDCFSITEYMAIDHFGITAPGQSWRAVEDGTIALGAACRSTLREASSALATPSAPLAYAWPWTPGVRSPAMLATIRSKAQRTSPPSMLAAAQRPR